MSNSSTSESGVEGGESAVKFTTLAEALLYLNRQRQANDVLYCIILKDSIFYVTRFTQGRQLLEEGYHLVYGG